jgi:hypothetical protein
MKDIIYREWNFDVKIVVTDLRINIINQLLKLMEGLSRKIKLVLFTFTIAIIILTSTQTLLFLFNNAQY